MDNYDLDKLYTEISNIKPVRRFDQAKLEINNLTHDNFEIMYALMIKYYLETDGTINKIQSRIPYSGRKANKKGGIIFKINCIPDELLIILTNFLDKIKSD